MREPSPRSSRLAIGGGLAALIAVGAAGFQLGRASEPAPAPVATATPAPPTPTASASATQVASVLGRADLVELADTAAAAFAAGEAVPAAVGEATGRRFDLVLPFGCLGPNDPAATSMGWQYEADTRTLRVSVIPVIWSGADWHMRQDDEPATATGFWINRPWARAERCPTRIGDAAPVGTAPVTLPGQTLAIATFASDDAQGALGRDRRAFETVQRVPEFDGSQGLRLRITGRIARTTTGPAVRCVQPAGIEQRPICAIEAAMDEVRIENAATGMTLATWTVGRAG